MNFDTALTKVGTPLADIEAYKKTEVRKFHQELTPSITFANNSIESLEKFIAEKIHPFLAKIERRNVQDPEIAKWLEALRGTFEKPNALRLVIRDAEKVTWKQISQTVYPDELDKLGRDALLRGYQRRLTCFGDVQGKSTWYMGLIETRVLMLAEQPGPAAVVVSRTIAPSVEEAMSADESDDG